MKAGGKFQSLAATARIANVPSVISNVFLGVVLIALWGSSLSVPEVGLLMLAGIFLYLGGNFLNDWADRDWDSQHRPERALPRGLFAPGLYLGLAILLTAAGLAMAAAVHLRCLAVAGTIATMVLLYTWIHKRSAWSVLPMGSCRGLLPVLGLAAAPGMSWILLLAPAALFLDIALLSWRARSECHPDRTILTSAVSRLASLLPALLLLFLAVSLHWGMLSYLGILPLVLRDWFCAPSRRRTPHALISALLASLPMLDWVLLLPAAWHLHRSSSTGAPLAIACLLLPPLAFALGRALQRFATAT